MLSMCPCGGTRKVMESPRSRPEEVGLLKGVVISSPTARWLLLSLATVGLLALGLLALVLADPGKPKVDVPTPAQQPLDVQRGRNLTRSGNLCPWKHIEGSLIPNNNIVMYHAQAAKGCMQHCEEDEKC